jgi:hypothetical protein
MAIPAPHSRNSKVNAVSFSIFFSAFPRMSLVSQAFGGTVNDKG